MPRGGRLDALRSHKAVKISYLILRSHLMKCNREFLGRILKIEWTAWSNLFVGPVFRLSGATFPVTGFVVPTEPHLRRRVPHDARSSIRPRELAMVVMPRRTRRGTRWEPRMAAVIFMKIDQERNSQQDAGSRNHTLDSFFFKV